MMDDKRFLVLVYTAFRNLEGQSRDNLLLSIKKTVEEEAKK